MFISTQTPHMKYFLALLLFVSLRVVAQDYKAQIAAHRKQYMADFLDDKNSPVKKDDLQFLRFYDADSTYRIVANVKLLNDGTVFTIPAFTGQVSSYIKYAVLTMTIKGEPIVLTVYKNIAFAKVPSLTDYVFLPFTDNTNGKETYGGGRYIDLRDKDFKNNTVVIDFNKAYNPYCAVGGNFMCPKPPDENQLQIAIPAGEKLYAKAVGH